MIPILRRRFNSAFTAERYEALLHDVDTAHYWAPDFRIAETPRGAYNKWNLDQT